jgi:hypothetical protein
MKHVIYGKQLDAQPDEIPSLVSRILAKTLRAKKMDAQSDGDMRYWGVDPTQSPVLQRLYDFGVQQFQTVRGKKPEFAFIMVNYIDPVKSPNGSGGGWHRDSFRLQYKAFCYLTNVERETQGAFCFLPGSNGLLFRAASAAHRLATGANRYSDRTMNALTKLGFNRVTVLKQPGIPFFLNTSLVHRGLPISENHRVMATVYMFEEISPEFASYL